MVAQQIACCSW